MRVLSISILTTNKNDCVAQPPFLSFTLAFLRSSHHFVNATFAWEFRPRRLNVSKSIEHNTASPITIQAPVMTVSTVLALSCQGTFHRIYVCTPFLPDYSIISSIWIQFCEEINQTMHVLYESHLNLSWRKGVWKSMRANHLSLPLLLSRIRTSTTLTVTTKVTTWC